MKLLLRKCTLALLPRSIRITTTLSDGTRIAGRNRAGYGGRGIFVYRETIEPEYEHVLALMKNRSVFMDVGANTGIYSLKVARFLGESGTVVAFEPNPEIAADLHHSIQLNKLTNLRLRVYCVGSEMKPTTLWMNDNRPNRFSLYDKGSNGHHIATFTMPIDEIMKIEKLNALDYLKIDAEGAEDLVLEGARSSIERYKPLIQCEDVHCTEFPFLEGYRTFKLLSSNNRLMLHKDDTRIEIVERVGFTELRPVVNAASLRFSSTA